MPSVVFTPQAEDNLAKLDKQVAQRILKRIRWFVDNFESVPLEALSGQFQGVFELRSGSYRILFTLDEAEEVIVIRLIKHRRDVYK